MSASTPAAPANPKNLLALLIEEFAKCGKVQTGCAQQAGLLLNLVKGFSSNPLVARRGIRELLTHDPVTFYRASLGILNDTSSAPGLDYLMSVLLESDVAVSALTDAETLPIESALSLARNLYRLDEHLDARLLRKALNEDSSSSTGIDLAALERTLEIIDAISDCCRLVPYLMKLMRMDNPRIRSKAVLLLGRAHRNAEWLREQLLDPDPRVRANTVEGMLDTAPGEKELDAIAPLTKDDHHRVASTALLVLYRNGRTEAGDALENMASHPSEMFRTAAAWAMGQSEDDRFLAVLQRMARTESGNAKRMAIRSCILLRKTPSTGSVETV
jgi:hypothetical protein